MGISKLLRSLHNITELRPLSAYAGLTAGVDVFGWLHRGLYSAELGELVSRPPELVERPVKFVLEQCDLLIRHGVRPYLVFDGAKLAAKRGTEEERGAERRESREKGLRLIDDDPQAARQLLAKAEMVTAEHMYLLFRCTSRSARATSTSWWRRPRQTPSWPSCAEQGSWMWSSPRTPTCCRFAAPSC